MYLIPKVITGLDLLLSIATGWMSFKERTDDALGVWISQNQELVFVVFMVSIFLLGALLGWDARALFDPAIQKVANRPRKMARKEKDAIHERARAQQRESAEKAATEVKKLDPDSRALLVALNDGKRVFGNESDWRYSISADDPFFTQFFDISYIDGNKAKLKAKPMLNQLFELFPDLSEGLSQTLAKHEMIKPDQPKMYITGHLNHTLPYWWWQE